MMPLCQKRDKKVVLVMDNCINRKDLSMCFLVGNEFKSIWHDFLKPQLLLLYFCNQSIIAMSITPTLFHDFLLSFVKLSLTGILMSEQSLRMTVIPILVINLQTGNVVMTSIYITILRITN